MLVGILIFDTKASDALDLSYLALYTLPNIPQCHVLMAFSQNCTPESVLNPQQLQSASFPQMRDKSPGGGQALRTEHDALLGRSRS